MNEIDINEIDIDGYKVRLAIGDKSIFAVVEFNDNNDIPKALKSFINTIESYGYKPGRGNHNFQLSVMNDKGFINPGSISVSFKNLTKGYNL